jgi:hypothetical protein
MGKLAVKNDVVAECPDFTEYMSPIPENREECLQMICADFLTAAKISTLRFWRIGRILNEMEVRGDKTFIDSVIEATGYAKRNIYYAKSLYEKCPNFEFLLNMCNSGRIEWSDIKLLLPIDDDAKRNELLEELATGKLDKKELKDKVKEVKEQEWKEKHGDDAAPDKRTVKDEKVTKTTIAPKKYFEGMIDRYESMVQNHTNGIVDLADYYALIQDEKQTTDQEYNECRKLIRKAINTIDRVIAALTEFKEQQNTALADMG